MIGISDDLTTSACFVMNGFPRDQVHTVTKNLGMPQETCHHPRRIFHKGFQPVRATDPAVYRIYEIVGV